MGPVDGGPEIDKKSRNKPIPLEKFYLRPTDSQRNLLSGPLGDLIEEEPRSAVLILRSEYLSKSRGVSFSVGDIVTETMIEGGVPFSVAVLDMKTQRRPFELDIGKFGRKFFLKNPAGHISLEAWTVLRTALSAGPNSLVLVEGEEDLMTAVAIDVSEEGSLVVYGQPGKGMVVVKIEPDVKRRIRELISSFPIVSM